MIFCFTTSCYYYPSPWQEFVILLQDANGVMILLVPAVIGYMLGRIFVTHRLNPRGDICVLGITETSATHAEMYGRKISWWTFGLHVLTGLLTFKVGLAFDFYYYVIAGLLD